jgi:hypothetical protein
VTGDEIAQAIKDYPHGKSPGEDGIDKRVLMALCKVPSFMIGLTRLYNGCIYSSYTPKRWNASIISPIPKPGKDPRYIANRRPVSLTVLFRRIFEKLMVLALGTSIKLNCGQGGFREGFSCLTHVLLAEQARHSTHNIRVFLDLKAAYDSVPIDKLMVKMGTKGVPAYLIRLVGSLFNNCSSRVTVNGNLTEHIPLQKGLFQGSILSPILFDVYIDDLAEILNSDQQNQIPTCLLFADDILLTSNSQESMQAHLDIVSEWCLSNEMVINVAKCGTFKSRHKITINGEAIPQVETYKYLGVPITKKGIDTLLLLESNYNKALGVYMMVKECLASQCWPPAIKINIYKVYIRSVMEYGAPILTLNKTRANSRDITTGIGKLQKLQTECLKWAFNKNHAIQTIESMSGTMPVKTRLVELTARFRLHLENSSDENPIAKWLTSTMACPLIKAASRFPIPQDRSIETIKNTYRAQSLIEAYKKSIMAQYISQECREENGMDACLKILERKIQTLAIAWRCNSFGVYKKCKKCNIPFNRRHTDCVDLGVHGDLYNEFLITKNSGQRGSLYTIVDHLLNKRKYHLFAKAMEQLTANLI